MDIFARKDMLLIVVFVVFQTDIIYASQNITYPANITEMTLIFDPTDTEQPVIRGTRVTVVCFWKNGNPPVQARLFNSQGNAIEGIATTDGQVRHTFVAVGCQDAGLIHCQAPGASHNKTVRLLVRCLSTLSLAQIHEKEAVLELTVRSHTKDFQQCILAKTAATENTTGVNNCDIISVRGIPPDMELTVQLGNVRTEEHGQWRLELTNDAGTGHVDFMLRVAELMHTTESGPLSTSEASLHTTEKPQSMGLAVFLATAAGLIVGSVLSGIIAFRLAGRARSLRSKLMEQVRLSPNESEHHSSAEFSENPYDEAADAVSPLQQVSFTSAQESFDAEPVQDYLHTQATTSTASDTLYRYSTPHKPALHPVLPPTVPCDRLDRLYDPFTPDENYYMDEPYESTNYSQE